MDWNKIDEELAERNRKASIEAEARLEQRRLSGELETIHDKGVRLGWWDEEGNSLLEDDEEDEGDDDPLYDPADEEGDHRLHMMREEE